MDRRDVLSKVPIGVLSSLAGGSFLKKFLNTQKVLAASCDTANFYNIGSSLSVTNYSNGDGWLDVAGTANGSQVYLIDTIGRIFKFNPTSHVFTEISDGHTWLTITSDYGPGDGVLWAISNEPATLGGGYQMYFYNDSTNTWTADGPGGLTDSGVMVLMNSFDAILTIDNRGTVSRLNSSGWIHPTNLGANSIVVGDYSPKDGTFVVLTQDNKARILPNGQNSWGVVNGTIGTTIGIPIFAVANYPTIYAIVNNIVYLYSSVTNSFSQLASQPSLLGANVVTASAEDAGTLFLTSSAGTLFKYASGAWTSKSGFSLTNVSALSASNAYALDINNNCALSSGSKNNLAEIITWTLAMIEVMNTGNHFDGSFPLTDVGVALTGYKTNFAAAANGTLPSFSDFQAIIAYVMTNTFTVLDTVDSNYMYYKPADSTYACIANWISTNCPPNTTKVNFPTSMNPSVLADALSAVYGIGAPNWTPNGWSSIVNVPSFGTTTVPAGASYFISRLVVGYLNTFATDVRNASSYSGLNCTHLKQALNALIILDACLIAMITVAGIATALTGVSIVFFWILFGLGMLSMVTTMLVALAYGVCTVINWANWGNL